MIYFGKLVYGVIVLNCINDFQQGRLDLFFKQESRLPSFSVTFYSDFDLDLKMCSFKKKKIVGDFSYAQFSSKEGYMFSFCKSYAILNADFSHADVYLSGNDKKTCEYEASYLLMQAYMFRLVINDNFMIHSAVAVYDNYGILFCGASGAGKSTQANLWKNCLGAWILNYDKPCVINDHNKYFVHGSPWSGKEAVYKNKCVPIKAIVFVNKSQEIMIKKLTIAEAYSKLFLHNYIFPLNEQIELKYMDIISKLSQSIPIYDLYCDISRNSVFILHNELFSDKPFFKVRKEKVMKYRVKNDFQMNKIADEYIVVPRGSIALNFNATVVFNETGAFLWKLLQSYSKIEDLALQLADKYSISIDNARDDITAFIEKMKTNNLLDIIED